MPVNDLDGYLFDFLCDYDTICNRVNLCEANYDRGSKNCFDERKHIR